MPFFKTNRDIFKTPWEEELYDENAYDSDVLILPETKDWDYKRELQIEDVEIWEQIFYKSGGTALYAAYKPYAEFYLITGDLYVSSTPLIETFYGKLAAQRAYERSIQLGMNIGLNKIWVDQDKMWLYSG